MADRPARLAESLAVIDRLRRRGLADGTWPDLAVLGPRPLPIQGQARMAAARAAVGVSLDQADQLALAVLAWLTASAPASDDAAAA